MGGRGAAIGTKYYPNEKQWLRYGDEYQSVLTVGNIKFVIGKLKSNSKAPKETRTKGRVYVTINKKENKPKYITYYDENGKKFKQLDINQHHRHKVPVKNGFKILDEKHRHLGYEHDEKGSNNLSKKERRMVAKVLWEWRKYQRSKRK